ncbi:MAG TPA: transglutaminase domain-containing protein [Chitinophagaceae bacterium]|nr:transglutaminase domain-containing protein [Chitinophagaceae bacterium]
MRSTVKAVLLAGLCLFLQNYLNAQDKTNVKFGKVDPADFDLSAHKFDTSAGAVYIADVGSTDFEGNNDGWFSLYYKRQVRIKILNKNGFDAASFEIPIYVNGTAEERVEKLKATTYNLEDGKVVQTRLEEKSVFKDKISRNLSVKKFTMPAVKEGSIVEVSYTVKSDFIRNLQPWNFQGRYPRIWSEYMVRIPECFNYVFLSQGYHAYHIKTQNITFKTYSLVEDLGTQGNRTYTMKANVYDNRWVMKDVPPLKEEAFVTSLNNYISSIQFQLSEFREPLVARRIMSDWFKVSDELLKDEDFGQAIDKSNNWLDDDMKSITGGAGNALEKAKKVYAYVRSNFTCTDHSAIYLQNPLRTVFKNRNGSVSEINMLLIAMLKHEGINAQPVLLSTRNNGLTHEVYPLMDRFNYVIAGVNIDDKTYYLDATEPKLGFGKLPIRCYNGHARIIDASKPYAVYFQPDSLKETKMTSVFIINDDKGKVQGTLTSKLGYFESLGVREKMNEGSKDEYLKTLKKSYPSEYELSSLEFDSLNNFEQPVQMKYNIELNGFAEDIVYFNPMLVEGYKDNYFKAAERKYPVEMPYTFDEIYIFNMQVPEGYVVDELPKSSKVSFNDDEGYFEYMISLNGNTVMLRSRIKFNKAIFQPDDYEGLRSFFDHIVKKHGEQIVFKKKK